MIELRGCPSTLNTLVARVDPERVVAADRAAPGAPPLFEVGRFGVRAITNHTTNRRRGAIGIAGRVARIEVRLGVGLVEARSFFRQHQGRVRSLALERRDRGVGPVALEIGRPSGVRGSALGFAAVGFAVGRACLAEAPGISERRRALERRRSLRADNDKPEQRDGSGKAGGSHLIGSLRRCP